MKQWMKLGLIVSILTASTGAHSFLEDSYHQEDSYENDRIERSYESSYDHYENEDSFEERPSEVEKRIIRRKRRNVFRPRVKSRVRLEQVETKVVLEDEKVFKTKNFYTSPVGAVFGSFELGADFKLTRKTSWGLKTSFLNSSIENSESGDITDLIGQSVGLRYNLFFNGPAFTDSFILQTEVGMMRIDATNLTKFENNDLSGITKKSSFYGNLGVGYGWFWNKFNIQVLGGVQYFSEELTPEVKHALLPGEEGVLPWMGLNLGVSL